MRRDGGTLGHGLQRGFVWIDEDGKALGIAVGHVPKYYGLLYYNNNTVIYVACQGSAGSGCAKISRLSVFVGFVRLFLGRKKWLRTEARGHVAQDKLPDNNYDGA